MSTLTPTTIVAAARRVADAKAAADAARQAGDAAKAAGGAKLAAELYARAAEMAQPEVLKDDGQAGLSLYVGASGKRVWYLQCRDASGRPRKYKVGEYPALGLAAARDKCRNLREDIRRGADPIADAKARRRAVARAKDGQGTLMWLLGVYERQVGGKLKSWAEYRRRIESVFAPLLSKPLTELTLEAMQTAADDWPSAQSAAAAVRYVRPLLKWSAHVGRKYVARDLVLITPPATTKRRQRVLSPEELAKVLPVLRDSKSAYRAAHEFILLTIARREDVSEMRWRDVDWPAKTWTIPDPKNTNPDEPRPPHVVPLSKQALALLRKRRQDVVDPDAFVFVSDGDGSNPIDNWDRATKAIHRESQTTGWHRHDLRRTGSTMLGNEGIDPHVVKAALNHLHISDPIDTVYNISRYRPQVADALQRLADRLDAIAAGKADVVPLRRKAPTASGTTETRAVKVVRQPDSVRSPRVIYRR